MKKRGLFSCWHIVSTFLACLNLLGLYNVLGDGPLIGLEFMDLTQALL